MEKIAVLSDIHGNLPALRAVLAEVEAAGVDLVVLNGDLADGPFPAETLALLDALGDRAVWLRGNGDRGLAEAQEGRFAHPDPQVEAMTRWAAQQLTPVQCRRLGDLPLVFEGALPGLGTFAICHASARHDNEMFLADGTAAHFDAAFGALAASTIVIGHSHMPFDLRFERRRLVNAGSIGMPYGHDGASWLRLGPGAKIEWRRTRYDLDAAAALIRQSGMPGAEAFAAGNVLQPPSAEEARQAFARVVERQQRASRFD